MAKVLIFGRNSRSEVELAVGPWPLRNVPGITVAGDPAGAFVAVRMDDTGTVRLELRRRGWAVRRGDTFPGLGAEWLRIAVRDTATTDAFTAVLTEVLKERE